MDDNFDRKVKPRRITILKVPVDILPPEDIEPYLKGLMADQKNHQIVLLSIWDLMRARRNAEYRALVQNASLVLPISMSVLKGARFLKYDIPVRWMPFDFIIATMRVLERWGKSLYLFGAQKKVLQLAEKNIKQTFPGLKVVGRYQGYYPRTVEPAIIQAVQKSTPTLLMVGAGVPGKEKWIQRNMKHFQSGLYLWVSDCFDVFAEKKKRASKETFRKGLESVPYSVRKPWKIFRIFIFVYFKILLVIYRIRKM